MVGLKLVRTLLIPLFLALLLISCGTDGAGPAEEGTERPSSQAEAIPAVGRWDAEIEDPGAAFPSWFEIENVGGRLKGRFVGRTGSARPITDIRYDGRQLRFTLPPQYERQKDDLLFIGSISGDEMVGETLVADGQNVRFTAHRAPRLDFNVEPVWGEPIQLLTGSDLSNWRLRNPDGPNGWSLEGGILTNRPPSVDLVTRERFRDFKLHLEFKMPPNSNSGVYLRGRYEVQIQDDYGKIPDNRSCGAIYGFIAPAKMAAKESGQWNSYDITLIGRRVSVIFNGEAVIDAREIPGITGGALDSREGEPGPLMLQGDHRAISYRNILLTPASERVRTKQD